MAYGSESIWGSLCHLEFYTKRARRKLHLWSRLLHRRVHALQLLMVCRWDFQTLFGLLSRSACQIHSTARQPTTSSLVPPGAPAIALDRPIASGCMTKGQRRSRWRATRFRPDLFLLPWPFSRYSSAVGFTGAQRLPASKLVWSNRKRWLTSLCCTLQTVPRSRIATNPFVGS